MSCSDYPCWPRAMFDSLQKERVCVCVCVCVCFTMSLVSWESCPNSTQTLISMTLTAVRQNVKFPLKKTAVHGLEVCGEHKLKRC